MLTSLLLAVALTPGNHTIALRERLYIVHVPPGVATARPVIDPLRKLLLDRRVHPSRGGQWKRRAETAIVERARIVDAVEVHHRDRQREQFIAVYPNGTGPCGLAKTPSLSPTSSSANRIT